MATEYVDTDGTMKSLEAAYGAPRVKGAFASFGDADDGVKVSFYKTGIISSVQYLKRNQLHRNHLLGAAYYTYFADGQCEVKAYCLDGNWHRPREFGPAVIITQRSGEYTQYFYEYGKYFAVIDAPSEVKFSKEYVPECLFSEDLSVDKINLLIGGLQELLRVSSKVGASATFVHTAQVGMRVRFDSSHEINAIDESILTLQRSIDELKVRLSELKGDCE